jgi:hypothetical protein
VVATNWKRVTKGVEVELGSGLRILVVGMVAAAAAAAGTKPCEVGKLVRMRCWLRKGTWKRAQPRGVKSHLRDSDRMVREGGFGHACLFHGVMERVTQSNGVGTGRE